MDRFEFRFDDGVEYDVAPADDGFIAETRYSDPPLAITVTVTGSTDTLPVVSITAGTVSDSGVGTMVTFSVTAVPAPESPITVTASLVSSVNADGTGEVVERLVPSTGDTATGSVSAATGDLTYTIPNALHAAGTITATLDAGTGYMVSTEEGENTTTASAGNTLPSFGFTGLDVNADGSITVHGYNGRLPDHRDLQREPLRVGHLQRRLRHHRGHHDDGL